MSAGKPPLPPPYRPRMASVREDPRRETDDRPPREPTPDEHLRRVVHQLATAELQRAQVMPQVLGYLKTIAEAVGAPAGFAPREKTDSRLNLEAELAQFRSGVLAEARAGESMRAEARMVQRLGAFVLSAARQSWHVAIAVVVAAALGVVGTVLVRDCLPAIVHSTTAPAPAAPHP